MNRACFSKGRYISSILRGLIKGVSNLDKAEFSQWRAFFTKRFEMATITLATKFPVLASWNIVFHQLNTNQVACIIW